MMASIYDLFVFKFFSSYVDKKFAKQGYVEKN